MREFIGAIGLALVLITVPAAAQSRPDLSGTWIHVEESSAKACTGSLTVTQDAVSLRVASKDPSVRPDVYNFDGTDTRQTFAPAQTVASPRAGAWTVQTLGSV